ncbi:hypothetical protein C8R47DRAFT_1188303 [Mycena vitilis]|nr:hypothetical protein C8R47DRAFT_1188303 [Mycena vitilis]
MPLQTRKYRIFPVYYLSQSSRIDEIQYRTTDSSRRTPLCPRSRNNPLRLTVLQNDRSTNPRKYLVVMLLWSSAASAMQKMLIMTSCYSGQKVLLRPSGAMIGPLPDRRVIEIARAVHVGALRGTTVTATGTGTVTASGIGTSRTGTRSGTGTRGIPDAGGAGPPRGAGAGRRRGGGAPRRRESGRIRMTEPGRQPGHPLP